MAYAQPTPVTVTIAVSPPYTSHIDDYISQPNKVMATLTNTTMETLEVYLQGSIVGYSGLRVYTDPDFKMSPPITLLPGMSFQITRNNLEQVFDADELIYEGISENDIVYGTGLPEDDYTICLKAYDYNTDEPVSGDEPLGCSNMFTVLDLEPPMILSPSDGDTIAIIPPQNLVISWTWPPGAPVTTEFNLKLVEVLPSDRNINDAIKSATHPVFFETKMNVTAYVIGPADPSLVTGKTYACVVTAIDPAGQIAFRNNGESEVIGFVIRQ